MQLPNSRTFAGLMDEMAARFGARNFVTVGDKRLSYSEFRGEVRQLAKGLHALGVRRGDKVALLMGNQAEWLIADFAVTALGAILVAVNTWWKQSELQHALATTEASVLLMVDGYLGNDYLSVLSGMGDLGETCPQLRHLVVLGASMPANALPYEVLLEGGRAVPDAVIDAAQQAVLPDDTAYLLFTSGSTSRSKAVRLTHRGCIENCHGIGENMHLTEQDRMLIPTSMFWSFSCVNALFAVMTHGGSLVLLFKYDTGEMLRQIEQERCTGAYTLPHIVQALRDHPDLATRDLSTWRTGICRSHLIDLMAEIGPQEMVTGYGLTECYGHSVQTDGRSPLAERRRHCGRPLPGVEMKLIDPETGRVVPAGTAGEILLRGHATPGYYNDPERTREAIDAEGWFHTGDVGILDDAGMLAFKGRFKELIKTGGINVSPADVEEVLMAHPDVQQAVVVGIPDAARDEIVAAMVVVKVGAQVTPEALIAHCKQTAAVFKVPRFLRLVTEQDIPLTDTGKVHKGRAQTLLTGLYQNQVKETT